MGRECPRRGGGEPAPRHGFSTRPSVSPRPAQPTVPPSPEPPSLSPLYLHPPPPQQTLPPPPPPGRGRGPPCPRSCPPCAESEEKTGSNPSSPHPSAPGSRLQTPPPPEPEIDSRAQLRARAQPSPPPPSSSFLRPESQPAASAPAGGRLTARGTHRPGRQGPGIRARHPERRRASGRVFLFDRFKIFNLSFPRPAPFPPTPPHRSPLLPFPTACLAFLPPRLGSLPLPPPSSAVSSVLSLPPPFPRSPNPRPRCLQTPGSSMRSSRAECWAAASRARSPRWS